MRLSLNTNCSIVAVSKLLSYVVLFICVKVFIESFSKTIGFIKGMLVPSSSSHLNWLKFNVTLSPISTNAAQYLTSLKLSDACICFMAWFRALPALCPSTKCS